MIATEDSKSYQKLIMSVSEVIVIETAASDIM